jgi:nucleotide-binding universal stress UspA family protein
MIIGMRSKNSATQCAANESKAASRCLPSNPSLNKILVPIDFSNRSKKALQYAVHFAKQFDASLVLLHVLARPAGTDAEYDDEWKLRLRAWAYEFVPAGVKTDIQVTRGTEAIEIVNKAKNLAIDLMIISTHGRTGRAHALAGSLAERLVQLAPCPVLVIHEQEHDFIEDAGMENACVNVVPQAQGLKFIGADI